MAKGIECENCCSSCIFLNKQNKIESECCYTYECLRTPRKQVVGWMYSDSELKTMGCSDCNRIKVGTGFLLNGTNCFYCGSIQTKDGKKYLIYNASTYVQNGFYVDVVEHSWFSEHIKDIVIICQTKEQIEALKQTARFYKKRIMKREEERRKQKL